MEIDILDTYPSVHVNCANPQVHGLVVKYPSALQDAEAYRLPRFVPAIRPHKATSWKSGGVNVGTAVGVAVGVTVVKLQTL